MLDDILQGIIGVIVVIILVVIFAPFLIQFGELTGTQSWGWFGAILLGIFAVIVVIGTIARLLT